MHKPARKQGRYAQYWVTAMHSGRTKSDELNVEHIALADARASARAILDNPEFAIHNPKSYRSRSSVG